MVVRHNMIYSCVSIDNNNKQCMFFCNVHHIWMWNKSQNYQLWWTLYRLSQYENKKLTTIGGCTALLIRGNHRAFLLLLYLSIYCNWWILCWWSMPYNTYRTMKQMEEHNLPLAMMKMPISQQFFSFLLLMDSFRWIFLEECVVLQWILCLSVQRKKYPVNVLSSYVNDIFWTDVSQKRLATTARRQTFRYNTGWALETMM